MAAHEPAGDLDLSGGGGNIRGTETPALSRRTTASSMFSIESCLPPSSDRVAGGGGSGSRQGHSTFSTDSKITEDREEERFNLGKEELNSSGKLADLPGRLWLKLRLGRNQETGS